MYCSKFEAQSRISTTNSVARASQESGISAELFSSYSTSFSKKEANTQRPGDAIPGNRGDDDKYDIS